MSPSIFLFKAEKFLKIGDKTQIEEFWNCPRQVFFNFKYSIFNLKFQ